VLVRFEEIADRNASEALGKADLFIEAHERRALRPGEYWPDELIGLEVRDEAGTPVGMVVAVDDTPTQSRLMITGPNGDRLIPLVDELVPEIDIVGGYIVVRDVPGLISD
jgi:16S rRNA processing protein RimM